ncbi:MAG: gamma-glutamyl-gamma-aminobutyrate hydrolase family protein, partial [Bacteroidales bacterium]|nr:gamma-glutamyl-gamma-aminobutyrate hydrolase family protein [Bacteroidales bacterium]
MKHRIRIPILIALALSILTFVCSCMQASEKNAKILIAISKDYPKQDQPSNYHQWLLNSDSSIEVVNLYNYSIDSAMIMLEKCSGLLLSGGADVFPGRYNKTEDTTRCGEFDLHRDSIEFASIAKALKQEIPIM